MDRSNHYEAAFEAYLQEQGPQLHRHGRNAPLLCTVAKPLKNLDFIVHATAASQLLIDVKGRRFPAGTPAKPRAVWECWSTRDDLDALDHWRRLFGRLSGTAAVRLRHHPDVRLPDDVEDLWHFRGHRYLLRAVAADDYQMHRRVRSARWGTVTLPTPVYKRLAQPFRISFSRRSRPWKISTDDLAADNTPY